MLNSRDIARLRPDVAANCRKWLELCEGGGLDVLITQTVRDREYQEYLYAQGRTRAGSIITNGKVPTFHADTAGLAFDFCKNIKGHEYDDTAFFHKAAALAKSVGFSWGGDWKNFVDMPHIQWDNGGTWTGSMILAGKLPPNMPLWSDAKEETMRYETVEKCPDWGRPVIEKLVRSGILAGDGEGLDLSYDMIRLLVMLDRAGVWERRE